MSTANSDGPAQPPARGRLRHALLLSGLFLLSMGAGLVLYTTGSLSLAWALFPSLAVVTGLFSGLACSWRRSNRLWYFPATMLVLVGASLLIIRAAAPSVNLARLWPFLGVFAGISIIPAGLSRSGRIKPSTVILAISFILMGCFFLLFSLGIVRMSFRTFLQRLWPVFLIASGTVLLALSLSGSARRRAGSGGE